MNKKKGVLLVDDDADFRALTGVLLAHASPDFDLAAPDDPVALGEYLATHRPDAAIVARHLPWCDALALVERLKTANPQCAVVMVSQEPLRALSPALADLGLTAYLTKDPGDLVALPAIICNKTGAAAHTPATCQPRAEQSQDEQSQAEQPQAEQPQAEQPQAEQPQAEQPQTAAAQDQADLSILLREINHDLTQPLQILVRQARLLDEAYAGQLDTQGRSLVKNMVHVTGHLQALLDAIIGYHHMDGSDKPANIGDTLAGVLAALQPVLDEVSATVIVGRLPDLPLSKAKMARLFHSLLNNAIKFRSDAPLRIAIEALDVTSGWLFSVEDNGIGIDESQMENIFNLFSRLHPQEKYPGQGMGLSICKRIVEEQGGKIWARSNSSGGTTIFFTTPKQPLT